MNDLPRLGIGAAITLLLVWLVTPPIAALAERRARRMFGEPDRPNAGHSPVGFVESMIFYASFYAGSPGGIVLASAWLVFKTAAKWKTWESTEKLGELNPNKTPGEISARYEAFIAGTGANIVWALLGAGVSAFLGSAPTGGPG